MAAVVTKPRAGGRPPIAAATSDALLLTAAEVGRMVRKSKATIRRDVAAGLFPPPVQQHGRRILWSRAQIERWLRAAEARAEEGGAAHAK
jgi:predicted DNA-binding transcriptional regulator AlpA